MLRNLYSKIIDKSEAVYFFHVSKRLLFVVAALSVILASCAVPDYRDPSLSAEERTEALLKLMTVEEKIGQLICPMGWTMYEKTGGDSVAVSDKYRDFIDNGHGGMLWGTFRADPWTRKTLENGLNPSLAAKTYNELQRYAVSHGRLGIPVILAEEAPHGHMAIGTTVFPTGIGMASTWDTGLMTQVGRTIAEELRAQGGHIGYGPVIDLVRDPRWSRVEETYGEDVCLTSAMASALVAGESPCHNGYDRGIISTLKHFAAYGIPEGGHNGSPSYVGERELRENFLPPFKAAIDAGALSVMTSYNSIDGIPSTANPHLLRGVLRDEWGFGGFVVSDLESIDGLAGSHHVAADRRDAGEQALAAGVDVDLGANCFSLLAESVRDGGVPESVLDEAVRRVLLYKFRLGLFDNPFVDESVAGDSVRCSAHVELSREAARKSIVLLENNGILPLRKDMKVAVIGPNADNIYNQLGDYTAPQERSVISTVLDGVRDKIGADNVIYAKGCAIRDEDDSGISAAVRAARSADVSVVVVGGSSARDFKTRYLDTGAAVVDSGGVSDMESGEGFDRATLTLMGRQQKLLEAVHAVGKPMVVVYVEGRPLDKVWASENADALLTAWYPGQAGGDAVADVLFGDYNPAGRLPVSVPRSSGQIPVHYNRKFPQSHDYVEMPSSPLYPFGYGLSYTDFSYGNLKVDVDGSSVKLSCCVTNSGEMDGDEVVQLYVTDLEASVVRPRRQLKAFRRVHVPRGGTVTVEFVLGMSDFALYDRDMNFVTEPGDFLLGIGASSDDIRLSRKITLPFAVEGSNAEADGDFVSFVNPRIGSGGHGHVFVGAGVPFGMVQLGPTSVPQAWDWCSGYHDSDSTVIGFSHTHLEGTGIGDLFDITVMPVTGDVTYARGRLPEAAPAEKTGFWSYADRSREVCLPGYYSVPLTRYGILAELTATSRAGLHRYTFPASDSSAVVFDLENGGCWDKATDTHFEVVDSISIHGYRFSSGWAKNQKVFFHARFSRPFDSFEIHGKYGRANFRTSEGEKIVLAVGISPVDEKGAKNNLAGEAGLADMDFDSVAARARDEWNRELSKIKIDTDDEDSRTVFYTALYHSMIHPSVFCDLNGDYRGADGRIHRGEGFTCYTVFSLWDTYRAAMPLMTLIHPEKVDDIARTMMNIHAQQGKLPVWHLWGDETDCMVGNPGVIALADIVVKGFSGFDREKAFRALKDSQMNPGRGQGERMRYGYIPADRLERESLAFDMEYAIADGAMAEVCRYLGKEDDYEYFARRSRSYRNYFDSGTLFMRGRKSDGEWVEPFDPCKSEHMADVYCEGNAWQYTWLAPHDFDGLVELFGSREKFLERLDSLFVVPEKVSGENSSPDISGLIGQYAHGNEPSHHIIYFYTMAGQPWKTADLVRRVRKEFYFNDPNGLAGNEDAGQMSAWYLLSSLGFYQAEPAVPRFWIGCPAFRSVSVRVGDNMLTIRAENLDETNRYVQSVTLNGKNHTLPYIEYKDIRNGGELVFMMGAKPAVWYPAGWGE